MKYPETIRWEDDPGDIASGEPLDCLMVCSSAEPDLKKATVVAVARLSALACIARVGIIPETLESELVGDRWHFSMQACTL